MTTQDQSVSISPDEREAIRRAPDGSSLSTSREILHRPLPHLADSWLTRTLTRGTLLAFRRRILSVEGIEHILPEHDPFILALNHSQRAEAILVPGLLFFLRDGKRVHFLADWNFCLIPFVSFFYRCGQTIILTRKSARPRFLNIFKPLFTDSVPAFDRARQRLASGAPVGVFPEGTVNRDARRLLKGYSGTARLSLETGVPIVPAGIRFPGNTGESVAPDAPFSLHIGAPLTPPKRFKEAPLPEVRQWHNHIMGEIAKLAGKDWEPQTLRKHHVA